VLYFGLTHDGSYDCASPVRRSLVKSWRNLFAADCAAGDATCASGLTHAWRMSDLEGATDAFVRILNPPGKALGRVPVPFINQPAGANPFCNSFDANHPGTTSGAGDSDFQDLDPLRTNCESGGGGEGVCEGYQNFRTNGLYDGDLGVVLPIVYPDSSVTLPSDLYPTKPCSDSVCVLVAAGKNTVIPDTFTCPGSGLPLNQGYCFVPALDAATGDPRCISSSQSKCFDVIGKRDGRAYNMGVVVAQSQFNHGNFPKYKFPGVAYQFALDSWGRVYGNTFYRVHAQAPGLGNVPDPVAGTTGLCTQADATSQIGCLVDSDPCSVGLGTRASARGFPGTGAPAIPTAQPLKAMAVNGVPPFTPGGDPDLGLRNLLAAPGSSPLYPLAHRLFLNTTYGFGNLLGGEKELAQCFGTASILSPAMLASGLVPNPAGPRCVDYPEMGPNSTPSPNTQGTGNADLPGCAAAVENDACVASPPTDIAGVTVPEAPAP
jgi:hypothetical protein